MKRLIISVITSNIFFLILTSGIILSLNLTPLITHIRRAPEGRTFALIHNNVQDFFFYQSLMNEGANGYFLTTDPYTTESHQPSIIFSYFLGIGKLGKMIGLSTAIIYHGLRIILSIFFLLTSFYFLLTNLKIPHPRLTYIFFLFAAPFMNGDKPYMNWWTGMDPIRRVAYLPHHMAGGLLLVISIILIIKFFSLYVIPTGVEGSFTTKLNDERFLDKLGMTRIKHFFLLILIAALLAFIHTPSLFILLLIIPPALFIYNLHKVFKLNHWKFIGNWKLEIGNYQNIGLLAYWLIGIIFMFLMVSQTNRGFPWSQYIAWEKNLQFPLDQELIGAFGILLPFAIIGIWHAISSKKFEHILIACWFAVPLLLIPIAPRLNISNIRLIQGTPYLPLAILAVMGITAIERYLRKFSIREPFGRFQFLLNFQCFKIKNLDFISNFKFQISNYFMSGILILLFITYTIPTIIWSLKDQIREYWPIFGNVYLDNRLNNAFSYINKNFPPKTKTLSTFYTGNYLPSYTNTVSFIGHFGYTYNMEEKQQFVSTFFQNKMLDLQAKEFIKSNKITLIFQGPEEKPIYNGYLYPDFLKPVYDHEEVTLYVLM